MSFSFLQSPLQVKKEIRENSAKNVNQTGNFYFRPKLKTAISLPIFKLFQWFLFYIRDFIWIITLSKNRRYTATLKCIRQICFIYSIKSPQCTDINSKENFSIAIFFPRVWCTKSVKFHFRWGTKLRDQNQDIGNNCDVNSGNRFLSQFSYCELINSLRNDTVVRCF